MAEQESFCIPQKTRGPGQTKSGRFLFCKFLASFLCSSTLSFHLLDSNPNDRINSLPFIPCRVIPTNYRDLVAVQGLLSTVVGGNKRVKYLNAEPPPPTSAVVLAIKQINQAIVDQQPRDKLISVEIKQF